MTSLIPMFAVLALLLIVDFSLVIVLHRRERRLTAEEYERR